MRQVLHTEKKEIKADIIRSQNGQSSCMRNFYTYLLFQLFYDASPQRFSLLLCRRVSEQQASKKEGESGE
jgi:hypothetical protein